MRKAKCKYVDEHRTFVSQWEDMYVFKNRNRKTLLKKNRKLFCLICQTSLSHFNSCYVKAEVGNFWTTISPCNCKCNKSPQNKKQIRVIYLCNLRKSVQTTEINIHRNTVHSGNSGKGCTKAILEETFKRRKILSRQ